MAEVAHESLKKVLQDAFEFIDKPMQVTKKGLKPVRDENGVVHLVDDAGNTHMLMCEEDFQAIQEWKGPEYG